MAYTTINKHKDYFNTVLYTGNGSARTITTGLTSTDFIWNKRRDSTGNHMIYDVLRGVNKDINTDSTEAEETQTGTVTAFGSNSYTLGTHGGTNANGETRVSWNWSANGAGSSNSDGSITSTVSANTTAGFSIVKYTGTGSNATIGHGLGVAPTYMIVKSVSATEHWQVYHQNIGATKYIEMSSTAAEVTSSDRWNNTAPTSSVFSVSTHGSVNTNGTTYIAYCFAEKTGYSKFGSYAGNNNQDGPFIYLGFKPAFVLFKRSSAVENWSLYDNKRATEYNPTAYGLRPNINNAESAYGAGGAAGGIDILSNGFKIKEGGTNINDGTYIYMAFGQSLVGSNNVPCTAR